MLLDSFVHLLLPTLGRIVTRDFHTEPSVFCSTPFAESVVDWCFRIETLKNIAASIFGLEDNLENMSGAQINGQPKMVSLKCLNSPVMLTLRPKEKHLNLCIAGSCTSCYFSKNIQFMCSVSKCLSSCQDSNLLCSLLFLFPSFF